MASKKFQKGSEEFMMFQEYYGLVQKYYVVEKDNFDYWKNAREEAVAFAEKYKEIPLAVSLSVAMLESLDFECKKMCGKGDNI